MASETQEKTGILGRLDRLQGELWDRLGPANSLVLLAGVIGMAAGLLAVLLKNGVGWLRSLPEAAGGEGAPEFLFVLPITGLILTQVLVRKGFGGRHPGPGIPATAPPRTPRRTTTDPGRPAPVGCLRPRSCLEGAVCCLLSCPSPSRRLRPSRAPSPSPHGADCVVVVPESGRFVPPGRARSQPG